MVLKIAGDIDVSRRGMPRLYDEFPPVHEQHIMAPVRSGADTFLIVVSLRFVTLRPNFAGGVLRKLKINGKRLSNRVI
jgi:hypothetical protein